MDGIFLGAPLTLGPRFIAFSRPLSCLLAKVIGYDEPIHGEEAIEKVRRALKDKLKDPYGYRPDREGKG